MMKVVVAGAAGQNNTGDASLRPIGPTLSRSLFIGILTRMRLRASRGCTTPSVAIS